MRTFTNISKIPAKESLRRAITNVGLADLIFDGTKVPESLGDCPIGPGAAGENLFTENRNADDPEAWTQGWLSVVRSIMYGVAAQNNFMGALFASVYTQINVESIDENTPLMQYDKTSRCVTVNLANPEADELSFNDLDIALGYFAVDWYTRRYSTRQKFLGLESYDSEKVHEAFQLMNCDLMRNNGITVPGHWPSGVSRVGRNTAEMSFSDVYELLLDDEDEDQDAQPDDQQDQDSGESDDTQDSDPNDGESGDGESGDGESGEDSGESGEDSGDGDSGEDSGEGNGEPGDGDSDPGDSQDGPGNSGTNWMRDSDDSMSGQDVADGHRAQIEKGEDEADRDLATLGSQRGGSDPLAVRPRIRGRWREILRRVNPDYNWTTGVKSQRDFRRTPRALVGVAGSPPKYLLPDVAPPKKANVPTLIMAVDVSGSITQQMRGMFLDMIDQIPEEAVKVRVVLFHTIAWEVSQEKAKSDVWDASGGTDIMCVQRWIDDQPEFEHKKPYVAAFSDGEGYFYLDDQQLAELQRKWFFFFAPKKRYHRWVQRTTKHILPDSVKEALDSKSAMVQYLPSGDDKLYKANIYDLAEYAVGGN